MNEPIRAAIWLFVVLPEWFFATVLNLFGAGILSVIPAFGTLCLIGGVALAVVKRHGRLLIFLLPIALCQLFIVVAGILRGQLKGQPLLAVLVTFLVLQALIIGYILYRSTGARQAATPLALFCISYALFTSFVGGMAFSNDWL